MVKKALLMFIKWLHRLHLTSFLAIRWYKRHQSSTAHLSQSMREEKTTCRQTKDKSLAHKHELRLHSSTSASTKKRTMQRLASFLTRCLMWSTLSMSLQTSKKAISTKNNQLSLNSELKRQLDRWPCSVHMAVTKTSHRPSEK